MDDERLARIEARLERIEAFTVRLDRLLSAYLAGDTPGSRLLRVLARSGGRT